MGFKCGIVGLPNVGKSTLFNALIETAAAQAANYPFTTIEPNVGDVAVPDTRLEKLAAAGKAHTAIPTRLTFIDIAGLVRGASKGEGLGNQFLAHIREVDAIAHVLRCFENGEVTHVEGRIDPIGDAETVDTELMLADLDALERRRAGLEKKATSDKEARAALSLLDKALAELRAARPARRAFVGEEEKQALRTLQLLTAKPVLYVCNVEESAAATGNAYSRLVEARARAEGAGCVVISAKIEAEIAGLDRTERAAYLESLGLAEPGLSRLVRAGYQLLGLITFFTVNQTAARAWAVRAGTRAVNAAGLVHTDFEKGFVRAETIAWEDYVAFGGETGAREAGKMRLEGKDYLVRDGDVLRFRVAG
jgi:GTP-binding protein YchF